MNDVISAYQKWKEQGQTLRAQAKDAMEARYRELLLEAVQVAQEYQRDFGAALKPPAPVTAFRFKAGAKGARKGSTKKSGITKTAASTPAPSKPDAKTAALQKQLDHARKRLDAAKGSGKPTKNIEDRIYEIEDELRLAGQKG